jgi:hypothetical protein
MCSDGIGLEGWCLHPKLTGMSSLTRFQPVLTLSSISHSGFPPDDKDDRNNGNDDNDNDNNNNNDYDGSDNDDKDDIVVIVLGETSVHPLLGRILLEFQLFCGCDGEYCL